MTRGNVRARRVRDEMQDQEGRCGEREIAAASLAQIGGLRGRF
jgi:hypothetical protein